MDLVTVAKKAATLLGTASVLGYITGYLAMRARASAFGTDLAFTLVDEAYVFAGFRFLFITIIFLLLAAPVAMLIRAAAVRIRTNWSGTVGVVEWALIFAIGIATLAIIRTVGVSNVLLQPVSEASVWHRAILGDATALRLGMTFSLLILVSLTALWLRARASGEFEPFDWVLGALLALQVFMLPIQHGAYFADRNVRVLEAVPAKVSGVVAPIGIVDRTRDHVTLMAHDLNGLPRLVTVKRDDLSGIPIQRVESLKTFVTGTLQLAAARPTRSEEPTMTQEAQPTLSFWSGLRDQLNITLGAIGSLGSSDVESGELWVVDLDGARSADDPRRIGTLDDLSWPVVAGDTYYALLHGQLVQLTDTGVVSVRESTARWQKLLGVTDDGTLFGLVRHDGETRAATLQDDGTLTIDAAPSEAEKDQVAVLQQETRSYEGNRDLFVERAENGRGFDVYFKLGDTGPTNVSDCGDDSCGQPALAADFSRVVYIRRPRF